MESKDRVTRIAALARLDLGIGLTPEEAGAKLDTFAGQFDSIVALMDTLADVETTGIEPLYWPLAVEATPPREDEARRHTTRDALLANAPEQDGQFFIVPRIV